MIRRRLAIALDDGPACPACELGEKHAHRLHSRPQAVRAMVGFCECGCGHATALVRGTDRNKGDIKGQPRRFILGHSFPRRVIPLHARFWSKVRVTSGCWEWMSRRNSAGYGQLYMSEAGRRKTWRAPRVAWLLSHGPIPPGLFVLHRCDNPPCVNPDHLFLGNTMDNAQDMMAKGRGPSGERNGNARLTAADVQDIRDRLARGEATRSIARIYGVDPATIRRKAL